MNKKISLIFASLKEANQLLNHSKIKFKKINNIFYSSEKINIHITGVGKKKVCSWLKSVDMKQFEGTIIIKAGTCAVFDYSLELLRIFIPSFVLYNNKKISINLNNDFENFKNLKHDKGLITLDKPLSDKKTAEIFFKQNLSSCDMETYFLVEAFKDFIFIPILTGTDRADEKAIFDFLKNIKKASMVLKEFIENI